VDIVPGAARPSYKHREHTQSTLLFGILSHALLDPGTTALSCFLELLLRQLPLVEGRVTVGNVPASLKARARQQLVQPGLEVRILGEGHSSPVYSALSSAWDRTAQAD
jgi:hypothetical protein